MKFSVIKVEEYSSCVKYTIQANVGKKKLCERFSFSKEQAKTEVWKQVVKNWLEKQTGEKIRHPKEDEEFEL